jgi:hypothetical protein
VCPVDQLASPKVLILQSAQDHEWGSQLAQLLAAILQLGDDEVRCKSMGLLQLPPSSEHYRLLQQAAAGVPVVIVVISEATLATPLEMFEIGAAWAARASDNEDPFIPVLIRGGNPARVPELRDLSTSVAPVDAALLEDLVGQIAGSLDIVPTNLGAHRGRLMQLALPRPRNPSTRRRRKHGSAAWLIAAIAAGALAAAVVATAILHRPTPPAPARERLGFEEQTTTWNIDARGFTNATRSRARSHLGSYSLKVDTELIATNAQRRTGEILFDLRKSIGVNSADLAGKSISAWVYAPAGSAGEAAKPNGLQLVVKDRNWKSQYGAWQNVSEGHWIELTLAVDSAGGDAHIDEGFQSNAIVAIGVKMSVGEGSKADHAGAIYIDGVNW